MRLPTRTQSQTALPLHLAVIMDGNRRWGIRQNKDVHEAYSSGAETLKSILDYAAKRGIRYFTAFCFGSDNWNRSEKSLEVLMNLFRIYFKKYAKELEKQGTRIVYIGEKHKLPTDVAESLERLEQSTKHNTKHTFQVAFNYSGKSDIVQAVKKIATQVKSGKLEADSIDQATLTNNLMTSQIPDPDLLIRTSGEMRLSNFMLWQSAYTEFYFSPKLWPDFTPQDLEVALKDYASRERRYGGHPSL